MYKSSEAISDKWSKQMYEDANKYEAERNKNKWSKKELKNKPKKGYAAVKKAAKEMWRKVKLLLEDEPSLKILYKYQAFILLKLYSKVPFRNTFASLDLVDKKDNNYIMRPKKGNFKLVIRHHKTSKKTGATEITLDRANTMAIRKFLKYKKLVADNDYFLTNMKKEKLSKASLGKLLHRVTKELLGKSFGSRLIRILAATDKKDEIETASNLAKTMLHSAAQQKTYVRKD